MSRGSSGKRIVLKTVILGDAAVGKTSLVQRFVHGTFEKSYLLTVGLQVSTKEVQLPDGTNVILSINDIGGQERFASIRTVFFKGAKLALFVFDLTRRQTLESVLNKWYPELKKFSTTSLTSSKDLKYILVGNKADLEDYIQVPKSDAERVKDKIGAIDFIMTSALNNSNVDEAFTRLAEAYLKA